MNRCCFDCEFFMPEGKNCPDELTEADWDNGTREGECRRRPPALGPFVKRMDMRTFGECPRVLATDWCGEFAARQE